MSDFYMIITSQIDYEWDVNNEFSCAGFPDRNKNTVKNMKVGDKIIYYVTGVSLFMAAVEVTGDYYYSMEQIWDDPYDLWPHRIQTKPLYYIDSFDKGIYIKNIWDNLEFIKNKVKWGSQVQGSFRRINEHDYKVIERYIKKGARA